MKAQAAGVAQVAPGDSVRVGARTASCASVVPGDTLTTTLPEATPAELIEARLVVSRQAQADGDAQRGGDDDEEDLLRHDHHPLSRSSCSSRVSRA